jgi:hypothetical protein
VFNPALRRFSCRYLPVFIVTMFVAEVIAAQQATPMHPAVVLVLKLVSTTHVQPTTGIVLTDNGLVLVPTDFVSAGDEIVVLDGGTDIVNHGRPAKIINPGVDGLAVLSVDGLKKPGITISKGTFDARNTYHLAAFPPAEYIAKGAQPLWVPVELSGDQPNGQLLLSPAALPYVTGPVIDDCGYLAGLSLTRGAQSLQAGKPPRLIPVDELKRILDSLRIVVPAEDCRPRLKVEKRSTGGPDKAGIAVTTETGPVTADFRDAPGKTTAASSGRGATVKQVEPTLGNVAATPSVWRSIPAWLLLSGFVFLAALIWKGIFFLRLDKSSQEQAPGRQALPPLQAASEEPETKQLRAVSDPAKGKPRSVPLDAEEIPDLDALPRGYDGVLLVEGLLDADTRFRRFCFVNTARFSIVIGRDASDINIEHPVVSRTHARLECDGASMTLSDLGSSNGTFIRGIPCRPGEVMFIAAEDEICLGDVRFRISVITNQAILA